MELHYEKPRAAADMNVLIYNEMRWEEELTAGSRFLVVLARREILKCFHIDFHQETSLPSWKARTYRARGARDRVAR